MTDGLERALALFDEYVLLPSSRRAEALAALAREDPDAREALEALLASDQALHRTRAGDHLLDSPPDTVLARHGPVEAGSTDPRLGTRLGPWRIVAAIGSGGMGNVYEAQRDDGQYRQRAALKCIRAELSSERLLDGFRRERKILAGLEHPGIAALLDGGIDDDGRPWFAMRYVEGEPIDAGCDRHGATLRRRVELLVDVCEAVAYAHQRMVLHQDIKPSNLLLTAAEQVQLVDFGLAASLASLESVPRMAVSAGYTAPEAMAGTRPSAAMDIWSLGMLAYRLLCGTLPPVPHPLLARFAAGAEPAPVPPMSRLAAAAPEAVARRRGLDSAAALSRRLAGDLDAIAARCTAWQPGERYASVEALRDDFRNWLHARPVQARNGGTLYRGARFLRRYPVASGLASLALAIALAGGGLAYWHQQRTMREMESSAALSRIFEQTLGTATLSGLGSAPLSSRSLLEDTERRVRSLSLQDHPRVLALGLSMLARNYAVVGDYAHASRLAEEAAVLQGGDRQSVAATQATRASLSNLLGRPAEALEIARAALEEAGTAADVGVRLRLMTEIARSYWDLTGYDDATRMLDQAQALAERTGDRAALAELLTQRGYWSTRRMRFDAAQADLDHAIRLTRDTHPLIANEARRYAVFNLLMQERSRDGRALVEEVLATDRRKLGETHPQTGQAWTALANIQCGSGDLQACADSLQVAERIVRDNYGERHPAYAEVLRIQSLLNISNVADPARDLVLLRRSEALFSAAYPDSHETVQRTRGSLARRLLNLAAKSAPREAERHRAEAIALLEGVLAIAARTGLPPHPYMRIWLAEALTLRNRPGDRARARRLLIENESATLRFFPPGFGPGHINTYGRAELDYRDGDLEGTQAILAALIPSLEGEQGSVSNRFTLRLAYRLRAAVAQRQGDAGQARTWLQRSLEHMEGAFGAEHPSTQEVRSTLDELDRTGRFAFPLD